jgi:aminopeptidase
MNDPRFERLAENLTGFSTRVGKGERVLLEVIDAPDEMVIALIRSVRKRGGLPYVHLFHKRVLRELVLGATEEQLEFSVRHNLLEMKGMDAYIAIRGSHNIFEESDVPAETMRMAAKLNRPVLDWRVKNTKWAVLRWPNPAMAQQALMSTEQFEDFYFRVCGMDYARMQPGMHALKALMDATDRVEIHGPETDLRFSIKDIGAVACGGRHNIPDGEVFSCPVKNSVEGHVTFNAPTIYQGSSFDGIRLVFKRGRIIEASGGNNERLNAILDSDAGARYIGEFALGFNPHILHPMRDILFDEKIAGSFHFTPGQAYDDAFNGNKSQIHWDMVCIQRADYGGGKIYFDGKLIRKDGLFVPKELQALNPDRLLGRPRGPKKAKLR